MRVDVRTRPLVPPGWAGGTHHRVPEAVPCGSEAGTSEQTPLKLAGMQTLPPALVPMPRMELPPARRAPSPAEEPPGVFFKFKGLNLCMDGVAAIKAEGSRRKGAGRGRFNWRRLARPQRGRPPSESPPGPVSSTRGAGNLLVSLQLRGGAAAARVINHDSSNKDQGAHSSAIRTGNRFQKQVEIDTPTAEWGAGEGRRIKNKNN